MKKIFKLQQKILLGVLVLGLLSISATISFFYFSRKNISQVTHTLDFNQNPAVLSAQTQPLTQTPIKNLKTLSVLLLGYGGAGHQGGFLTDVIQLLYLDFPRQRINLISVPRDLWVQLPSGKQAKINTAFTLGNDPNHPVASGGEIAKQMAANVVGIPIDYFIAIDFVGFKRLIGEELNGIVVNVPKTLDDPWYPIKGEELNTCGMTSQEVANLSAQYSGFALEKQFECRYQHLHFEKGAVKMEGGDALAYVRSRHGSAGGDFSRSQRQHALLKAIENKLWSIEALKKAPKFFKQVDKLITSDIDLEVIQYLMPALKLTKDFETKSLVLSTENVFTISKSSAGASIVVPKTSWEAVHDYVQQQLN